MRRLNFHLNCRHIIILLKWIYEIMNEVHLMSINPLNDRVEYAKNMG